MQKIILLVLIAGGIAAVIGVQRYITGGSELREIKSRARNFHSALRATAHTGGSPDVVREIVANMADEVDGVEIDPEDVEVVAIPIEVGEGNFDCPVAPFPPEFKKLSTLDQGNVKNLTNRCKRDVSLVGFAARAKLSGGEHILVEGWTYAREFD